MRRMSKNTKQNLLRIAAGFMAVCISPMLASGLTRKLTDLSVIMTSAVEYAGKNGVGFGGEDNEPLMMNTSSLLLYKPAENHSVITHTLPNIILPEKESYNEKNIASEAVPVMSQNISDYSEDLSTFNSRDGQIVKTTFTSNGGINFINLQKAGQVRNETELSNDEVMDIISRTPDFKLELNGEPEVLIMHTHTTESYQISESGYYDAEYTSRTVDPEKSVVAVGAEIANSIAECGIVVIHDGTVHDSPEYKGAYERSAETVKAILNKYPSIKVVLDVHRDAIAETDGSVVAAVAEVDGKNAAQVMIISAADDGTYGIPEFRKNLCLAALLQGQMEGDNPGITRPVLFQYCQYNQHLTTGSLLIEVGSHGNTVEQAKLAGKLIGKSIGKALLSY